MGESLGRMSMRNRVLFLAVAFMAAAYLTALFASRFGTSVALLVFLPFLAVAGLAFHLLAGRAVGSPVEKFISAVRGFGGDPARSVPVEAGREMGGLAEWYNGHMAEVGGRINKIHKGVQDMDSHTNRISVAVSEQAAVASEQSAAVAEITATTEELSASASQIAEHSKAVVDIATKTWEDTKKGAVAIETVIMKMSDIHNDNQSSIGEIVELGRKSKEITKVMEIINTIADQTKLIAFNAALEASSAGEAGRRFGVVAVEIRRLADSVMESTGEIEAKINEIQEAINRLVVSSEKGSKGIQEGLEFSSQTASLLSDIVDNAESTTGAAKQISLSTQQQKTASGQVVSALRDIVGGAQQTAVSVKQISEISRDLSALSGNMKELVGGLQPSGRL